ncbi:MAG: DUF6394 family protein [Gammaproteobacteria bacterium]|nr:DUF6394 family protein [Gammaproteobacteria bacterium]MCW8924102.1 DUF6394 family protein [Gammaproteobacteria bacterium]
MNLEKVIFSFFMILALTLNFGFFYGDVSNPDHHNIYELYAVIVINLIATVLKFGDRSQLGAMLLATSLVAVAQLISASVVWTFVVHIQETGMTPTAMATIVSLSGGAFLANVISVIILMIEAAMLRH